MPSNGIWQPISSDEELCFAYSTFGVSSAPASLRDPAGPSQQYDLISFLATAQKLRICFSNITWQPALQAIGLGGTAEVRESVVNLQTSFAFKRVREPPASALDESLLFQTLIAEILVLMHPSVIKHPHIIGFEGICWDVSLEDERVWPVLVFEKSPYGDLDWFANFGAGINMSLEERLKLCKDIVAAIMDMHASGIVHGDIKPQNILIFEDGPGNYTAKVVDFGYSTVFAGQNSLINIPKSWPWNAPEYHHRGFTLSDAAKMDAFCLGLLCLWLVHKERLSLKSPIDLDDLGGDECSASCANPCKAHQRSNLSKLKSDDSLVAFSVQATMLLDLSEKRKNRLIQFFESTLANDPNNRNANREFLSSLLAANGAEYPRKMKFVQGEAYDYNDEFQVSPYLSQLFASDYRVRRHIFTCVSRRVPDATLNPLVQASSLSIIFQLAICYHTGFGVSQDFEKSQALLSQSGRSREDLEEALHIVRTYQPSFTRNGNIEKYKTEGYLFIDLAQHYREHQQLDNAILQHENDIAALAGVFGPKHGVVLMLKSFLAIIYYSIGSLEKSKELQSQIVNVSSDELGRDHEETLHHLQLLANTESEQGQWEEAERIEVEILKTRKRMLGRDHLNTISSMANLASTYLNRGRWEDAEDLLLQVQTVRKRVLGVEHPQTLNCLLELSRAYRNQGRLEDALKLQMDIVAMAKRTLGPDHPRVLISMSNLSNIICAQGRWNEAEEIDLQILKKRKSVLGQEHPDTLESMANLAAVYERQGRYREAKDLNLEAINASHLGQEHPHTLMILSNLAYVYLKLGHWSESEDLGIQVIEKNQRILGASHNQTLCSMHNLAMTYQSQLRWKEAEHLQMQILKVTQMSEDHPFMLSVMTSVAGTCRGLGRWKDSEAIHLQILEKRKMILGHEHPETLNSMTNVAAGYYHQQGREKDAEEMLTQVLEIEKRTLGPEHADIISSMHNLGSILRKQGKNQEAEQMHQQQYALSRKLHGREHPLTISSMGILAETLRVQSRYEEAMQLAREAIVLAEVVHGKGNIQTLKYMDFEVAVLYQQGMYEESAQMRAAVEQRDPSFYRDGRRSRDS